MQKIVSRIVKSDHMLSLAANLSVALFGFVNFFILAHTYQPDVFGQWVLYIVSAGFIEMFRFGITRVAIIRFLSGATGDERKKIIGTNWLLGLVFTALLSVSIFVVSRIWGNAIESSGYALFFAWYPLLCVINQPYNMALTIQQASQRFDRILVIRLVNRATFFIFILLNKFFFETSILMVVFVHMGVNLSASLLSTLRHWDGFNFIKYYDRKVAIKILQFGKYTTGTLIGSNLLKSADTFIISLSPILGAEGVAIYSIPLKLTELLEVPLRSMTSTAFPKMSKACLKENITELKRLFYSYSGMAIFIFIPLTAAIYIMAPLLIQLIGGEAYSEAIPVLRIFALYGLLLPLDRFSGIALDSVNQPKKNFYKVLLMVTANIAGDIIAVYYFQSIIMVSVVTVLMTIVGLFMGWYYLNKEVNISLVQVFKQGASIITQRINRRS